MRREWEKERSEGDDKQRKNRTMGKEEGEIDY